MIFGQGRHRPFDQGLRLDGLSSDRWRFDDLWIALGEGPTFDDYLSGSGQYADQLRRLADRLR